MAVNKVIYYGEVLVDMSTVTVKPETLGKGETALDASGEMITGTAEIGGEDVTAETETYTDLLTDLEAAVDALPDAGSGGAAVETCTLICTNTKATSVFYQPTLGEAMNWKPDEPGDTLGPVEILCGSIISGIPYDAVATNATRIGNNSVWLITAPAGGTVTFS